MEYKDEMVKTVDKFIERAKTRVDFFYPNLDLRGLDIFNVFKGGQLVDEEGILDKEEAFLAKG